MTRDAYIELVTITTGSQTVQVTITDRQGTPLPFLPAADLPPNSTVVVPVANGGRFMPGGIRLVASVANQAIVYIKGHH